MAITLEQVALAAALQVGAELLGQGRQDRDGPLRVALGVGQMDLGRIAVQVQILDPDVDELADPRPGQEQGLDQEPAATAVAVGVIDEPLHLGPVQAFHRAGPGRRRGQADPAAHLLDHVLGLVIAEVVLAPETRGLADHLGEVRSGWRFWFLT